MTEAEILQVVRGKAVPHPTKGLKRIETHVSWVLLGDEHVYKIKKPLALSFLDFSTLENRLANCEREVVLNRRLAPEMYFGVLPVVMSDTGPRILGGPVRQPADGPEELAGEGIGEPATEVIDYAVWMRRMDETRQLDVLLEAGDVRIKDMSRLARILAAFHQKAPVVREAWDWRDIHEEFRDLQSVTATLEDVLGKADGDRIRMVIANSRAFLRERSGRIEARKALGFVRDGHGDLHGRNVLMTQPPVVFDCIEFSEAFRTLDVLSEIGFLCMDLERYGREDLSEAFLAAYTDAFPCMGHPADEELLTFYKMYRANVRMKVEALGLEGSAGGALDWEEGPPVQRLKAYARVFLGYAQELSLLEG